jgi:WD40 repeat protein
MHGDYSAAATVLLCLLIAPPVASQQHSSKRTDKYGDPLPPGAMTRLGSNRLSHSPISALSPDGKMLATFTVLEVRLFDVQTGKQLRSLKHDQPGYGKLAFSRDGKLLAVGSGTRIELWDPHKGELLRRWDGHKDFVRALTFSADNKTLASSGMDKSIRLWDASTGKLLHQLDGHTQGPVSLALSPDGKTLASASHDGSVRLWNVAAGKEALKLQPRGINSAVLFSPDGDTLIHAGWNDGFIRYYHLEQAKEIKQIGTDRLVSNLVMSGDGKFLVSAGGEGVIRIWDRESGVELGHARGTAGDMISHLELDEKGETLATGSGNGQRTHLWRITKLGKNYQLAKLHVLEGHDAPILSLAFSAHGKYLLSTGSDRTLRVWEHESGKELQWFFGGQFNATAALSPDGNHLAYVSGIRECTLFDIAAGKPWGKFKPASHPRALALSPDNRTLIYCGSSDSTIYLAETATGQTRAAFKTGVDMWRLAVSADGHTVAGTGYLPAGTGLWDLITGKELARWDLSQINNFAFAADGSLLTSSYKDHALRRWDLAGKEIGDPKKALRGVLHFAVFPDGQTIATSTGKQATVLRDAASGKVVHQLAEEYAPLAVSPDGRTLATGDGNAILLWAVDPWVKGDPVPPARLSKKEIDARLALIEKRSWDDLWADLADPDALRAYPALWGMVAQPAETERRLLKLLGDGGKGQGADENLRLLRAIEALEHLASPTARKVLQALVKDGPEEVRRAAQTTFARLKGR